MENLISQLLSDFEQGKMNRRQLVRSLALAATAAAAASPASSAGKGFKAVKVNHISYQVQDYKKTRDFYADLLGMEVRHDDGRQCYLVFDETTHLIARNGRVREGGPSLPRVDHFALTIDPWNREEVQAELTRRGLNPRPDEKTSFHVKDPDGFDLQICSKEMKPD
jgi:catechol 2,3-dioxygenase-like lactoylglutathione lyase family enzyme